MKLIITVVDDQDAEKLMTALTNQHIGVTRINSTGGILGPGNSTLLIGLEDAQVQQAIHVITETASPHPGIFPYAHTSGVPATSFIEVNVGGFVAFVLDMDHFEQV
ncbi:MAG: cyclic-di-AMP receptor [Chloroflexi bacterium]|nr:cyclic-di-AMP receptor [Chloroflexota bacterium]